MVIIVQILREEGQRPCMAHQYGASKYGNCLGWEVWVGMGGGVPDANLLTQIVSIYDTVTMSQQLKSTRPQNHRVLSLAGPCM